MRHIIHFNEDWRFAKCTRGETDPGEPVALPHTWYQDGDYYQGDAVY